MATYDNSYSRMVALLKVLLPVIALALLSTMFLISRTIDPTRAIPYADVDIEDLAREQRISGPQFSGVTSDGAAITFSADTAHPDQDNPNRFTAAELSARIETPDGASVDILSAEALIDGDANSVSLSGGVSLHTSTDYTIHAAGLTAALDVTRIATDGAVSAEGPLGRVEAGQVTLTRQEGDAGVYLLVFKGGVKLVYEPKGQGSR